MNIQIRLHYIEIPYCSDYAQFSLENKAKIVQQCQAMAAVYLEHSLITETDLEPLQPQLDEWEKANSYSSIDVISHRNRLKVVSDETLLALTCAQVKFEYKHAMTHNADISKQLIDLADKPIELLSNSASGNTYNTKCHVHMPGQALSMYNEVMLLEDTCTDVLQTQLASGWRIIAACPQPTQRRPDYILGRYNPQFNLNESAKRGS